VRHALKEIGERLTRIRGQQSQAAFAPAVGIHKNTLGTYERGEREPGAAALLGYATLGWNINWVLTGNGPEQLEALQHKESGGGESQSHNLNPERLTLALQLVEDALAAKNAFLPTPKRAEAAMLVYELLGSGLPEADVIPFARRAVGLAEGGAIDANRGTAAVGR
jgi:hypothetical protein